MNRALFLLLLFPMASFAQDMPLFTWAKNGEGWKRHPSAPAIQRSQPKRTETGFTLTDAITGKVLSLRIAPGRVPTSAVASKDGGTVYVGFEKSTAVWAYQVDSEGRLVNGAPYAPLRIRQGYDNSKEARAQLLDNQFGKRVTDLTRDSSGRIYAATKLGVQVFDPTGRPSGAMPLPQAGEPIQLGWDPNNKSILRLTFADAVWQREMLAQRD